MVSYSRICIENINDRYSDEINKNTVAYYAPVTDPMNLR